MEHVIKTHGITKKYGEKIAVNNVSLTVNEGDIYGFIGSNGAGKTTFIRLLMGLINPTGGTYELFGCDKPERWCELRAQIGCIVETPSLMLSMTAHDCLRSHAMLYGMDDTSRFDAILDTVGLSDTGHKKVKDFSLGMKQRMALAQCLLTNPKVLLLDEPINGMDPQGIISMRNLLLKLNKEHGITILISSHILPELQQLATRFGIIKDGVLIDEFTGEELEKKTIAKIKMRVSNQLRALEILSKFDASKFRATEESIITIENEHDFPAINRALIEGGVDLSIVSKDKGNLETYFIDRVGV